MESLCQYEFGTKAHLVFYSYDSNSNSDMKILLYKIKDMYSIMSTDIESFDNYAPTFAIARMLCTTFGTLFCEDTISQIASKQIPLSKEQLQQLSPRSNIKPYQLWNEKAFIYWLDKISQDIIQYDAIKGEVIYFIELPYLPIDDLNKQLAAINYFTSFAYCTLEDISNKGINNTIYCICPYTQSLLILFSVKDHIEQSKQRILQGSIDYFIVLACKSAGDNQAGLFHFPALFTGLYRKNCEKWIYLVASVDPLPNEDLLSKCKCLIIPGSDLNVYQDLPFLRKTEVFIKNIIDNKAKYPKLKLLGICFGLEIILNALGAKIDTVGREKAQRAPELLEFSDLFWQLDFVKKSNVKPTMQLKIVESHMDYIAELPKAYKYTNYAKSKSCAMEIIVSEDEKEFLIQGHPEYYLDFNIQRMAIMMLKMRNMEETEENVEKFLGMAKGNKDNHGVTIRELRQLCYYFMKN